jgi:hypothetical protein
MTKKHQCGRFVAQGTLQEHWASRMDRVVLKI